jgi:hypothetical protein
MDITGCGIRQQLRPVVFGLAECDLHLIEVAKSANKACASAVSKCAFETNAAGTPTTYPPRLWLGLEAVGAQRPGR